MPPQSATPQQKLDSRMNNREDWIDNSRPNAASMYYFLSGYYLSHAGEPVLAQEILKMAMAHDLRSPQIQRAVFQNGVKNYRGIPDAEGKTGLAELLRIARKDFQFDESMLKEAFRSYQALGDKEGMKWAASELNKRFPSAWALYFKYILEEEQTGKGDYKLLIQAEENLTGDELLAQMIAIAWMTRDDDRAISILQELPPSMLNETLLLTVMDNTKYKHLPDKRFSGFSYPRDREAMTGFLYYYLQKRIPERILPHMQQIVQTRDPALLYILAATALQHQSPEAYSYMLQELKAKPAFPEEESKYAALMLLQAIRQNDIEGIQELSERMFCTNDINLAIFTGYLNSELSLVDPESAKGQLVRDIRENLQPGLLKNFLLHVLLDDPGNRSAPAYVQFAEALFNKGFGDQADFMVILEHYSAAGDEDTQISYLRQALRRWPREAMFLNNLGYLLLSRPQQNWAEAERLIALALKLEPNSVHYQDSMAWLHYLRGELDAAKKYLPAMEAASSGSAELSYHIGMIYLGMQDTASAIKYLEQAVLLGNPRIYMIKAQEQLKLLK